MVDCSDDRLGLGRLKSDICIMKDWEISVPYLLPRIVSIKRIRSNTLPTKSQKSSVRTAPLGDVNTRWSAWRRSENVFHPTDYFYPEMIPDPDYSNTESDEEDAESADERLKGLEIVDDDNRSRRVVNRSGNTSSKNRSGSLDDILIQPRKPSNPYMESMERKNLHKELKFNQKYGKTIGSQKTELQVALEKYTEGKIKKDLKSSRRSSLEKILEKQALKIEKHEREGESGTQPSWIERLQRQHITSRSDPKTDEFFRVHARVVSNFMSNESDESSVTSSSISPSESE